MKTHALKVDLENYEPLRSGKKHFTIRFDDRNFKIGDILLLREWDPKSKQYTGEGQTRKIIHISDYMQQPGVVVLGLNPYDLLRFDPNEMIREMKLSDVTEPCPTCKTLIGNIRKAGIN